VHFLKSFSDITNLGVYSTASFTAIDKNFLRPFFTKEDKRRNSTDQAPNGMFGDVHVVMFEKIIVG